MGRLLVSRPPSRLRPQLNDRCRECRRSGGQRTLLDAHRAIDLHDFRHVAARRPGAIQRSRPHERRHRRDRQRLLQEQQLNVFGFRTRASRCVDNRLNAHVHNRPHLCARRLAARRLWLFFFVVFLFFSSSARFFVYNLLPSIFRGHSSPGESTMIKTTTSADCSFITAGAVHVFVGQVDQVGSQTALRPLANCMRAACR